jgi:hypothetical protein
MKAVLTMLFRASTNKRVACDDLLPLDDAWLRRAAAQAAAFAARSSIHARG